MSITPGLMRLDSRQDDIGGIANDDYHFLAVGDGFVSRGFCLTGVISYDDAKHIQCLWDSRAIRPAMTLAAGAPVSEPRPPIYPAEWLDGGE